MTIVKWKVNNWSSKPNSVEYAKQTACFYVLANGRRDAISSLYHRFFDTEAEALRAIADRNAQRARSKEIDRIKLHAVELLEALESAAGWLEWLDDPRSGLGEDHKNVIRQARKAIAKAKGEA
jgi:hypothetical protein